MLFDLIPMKHTQKGETLRDKCVTHPYDLYHVRSSKCTRRVYFLRLTLYIFLKTAPLIKKPITVTRFSR